MIKKQKKQSILIILAFMLVIALAISQVSAYKRLCLTHGQTVPSMQNPRFTCERDICQICVTDNYYPTSPNYCNDLDGCNQFGNDTGGGLDTTPPVMTINSPVNNNIYNNRRVIFDIRTNEESSIYYIDNINGRGVYSRLATLTNIFNKGISFKNGLNNITIKAIDKNGNSAETTKVFYVDSQGPKITKTEPKKGFATGEFFAWFTEENPVSLTLDYGNQLKGRRTANVNLNDCSRDNGKYYCTINVNLNEYNSQNIDYFFKLSDIAGSIFNSKPVYLKVDTASPIINNPNSMFTINGKYANFKINVTEPNLMEVSYYDNFDARPLWKKLCTSLRNGLCEKKTSMKPGEHIVDIKAIDNAGNSIIKRISINIE